jgi:hypothetical protein
LGLAPPFEGFVQHTGFALGGLVLDAALLDEVPDYVLGGAIGGSLLAYDVWGVELVVLPLAGALCDPAQHARSFVSLDLLGELKEDPTDVGQNAERLGE